MTCVKDGSLAYNAAAVGVVYDPVNHKQRFFQGKHTDDITCIAFSNDGSMVATGEMGARDVIKQAGSNRAKKALTSVYIWDPISMNMLHKLNSPNIEKTIIAVAFSPSGSLLGVCD